MPKTATKKTRLKVSTQKTNSSPSNGEFDLRRKQFFICADGAYIKHGRILLLKRNAEPFNGCWHLPGGHVEENETLKEALRREFKEETNLDVEIGRILDGRIEKTFDRIKIIVTFKITAAKGEIKLSSENEAYGWFAKTPLNSVHNYTQYFTETPTTANVPNSNNH